MNSRSPPLPIQYTDNHDLVFSVPILSDKENFDTVERNPLKDLGCALSSLKLCIGLY